METGRVYGQNCVVLLARYDRDTRSLKTYQCSFIEGLDEFSATLPKSGMMRNGKLYPQPMWVRPISGSGSGLWPTPQSSDHRDRGNLSTPAIKRRAAKGKQLNLSMSVSEVSGQLNPPWVEWLMGFPVGWTDLNRSVTL